MRKSNETKSKFEESSLKAYKKKHIHNNDTVAPKINLNSRYDR